VFNKVKAMLGGEVRLMITGSAPIAPEVLDFLKIAFCCEIMEGYGMTETSAASFTTLYGDPSTGIVGGPLANVRIKLRDIPEMGHVHTSNPPRGEICMKGSSIMTGYFRNAEKTAETISEDGWLYSGDVGVINANGSVKIIDRAKNIFKLSQGEYIAPEKLENVYVQSPYIMQCWIYGDSLRDYVIGFFVVDPANAKKWATAHNVELNTDMVQNNKEFVQMVYDDINKLAVENKLNSLEKPKQICMFLDPWTDQNDFLTPTMKLKRAVAKKLLEKEIATAYDSPVMKPTKK
jgi:long-chain acyl-CoA synthetase